MKKLYSIILIALMAFTISERTSAQTYMPMANEGAHWIVTLNGAMGWDIIYMHEYYCNGDTVIDNLAYKKIYRRELQPTMDPPPFSPASYYTLYGFLRDDVAAKQVYARFASEDYYNWECPTSGEILLYDFSLQQGDSINFCTMPLFYEATVGSIEQGVAFGITTRIFTTSVMFFLYYEGIGSQFGLFELMFVPVKSTNELEHTELHYYCQSDPCPYVLPEITLLTIGEVFDYEVGDEFQYRGSASGQTPNADRITITGKYYSQAGDTVFYPIRNNSYSSTVNWSSGQPVLEYFFQTTIDTLYYTNLQAPISAYDSNFLEDVYIYNSSELCNATVNEYNIVNNPGGFPGDRFSKEFGSGLGLTKDFMYSSDATGTIMHNYNMFYYKKGNTVCGNPDVVSTGGLPVAAVLTVYPNPAEGYLQFNIEKPIVGNASFQLINSTGTVQSNGTVHQGLNTVNIQSLKPGVYVLQVTTGNEVWRGKVVVR